MFVTDGVVDERASCDASAAAGEDPQVPVPVWWDLVGEEWWAVVGWLPGWGVE